MKTTVLLLCLLALALPASAQNRHEVPNYRNDGKWITVISPVTPQTWSSFSIQRHVLQWQKKNNVFVCVLTLTSNPWDNGNSIDNNDGGNETYYIPFPGVKPIGDGLYGATNSEGKTIPLCKDSGGGIELLPTTRVNLFSFSGRLVIAMLGTTDQGFATNSGNPWVIYNHGFHLQNLIQNQNLTN